MKYAVLGGAGSMGRIIVRDLLEYSEPGDEIVVADFDLQAAKALVRALPSRKGRVIAKAVDVRNIDQAKRALAKSFVLINSVQYQFNLAVMELALAVGAHYVDLGGLFHVTRQQLKWDSRFRRAGKIAVLGMGAAPGITNLLAKDACSLLDKVQEIHLRVAGADQTRYTFEPALPVSYSLHTILEELTVPPAVFTQGRTVFAPPMSGETDQPFPAPIGNAKPLYTLHSEVATLPASFSAQGVREVSFKIAFPPDFLSKVRFLMDLGLASEKAIRVGGSEIKPIDLVSRVAMAQPKAVPAGPLRQHEVIRAVVKGVDHQHRKLTWVFDCSTKGMNRWGIGTDIDTGSPPSIVARMLARGDLTQPGVLPPERCVPTGPFFRELAKRQMKVTRRRHSGWTFPV